jgi:hypothetical protein
MKTVVKQKIVKLKTKWRGIITLSYSTTIHFTMSKKWGWQQWGAPADDLWVSQPIVEKIWQEYLAEQL